MVKAIRSNKFPSGFESRRPGRRRAFYCLALLGWAVTVWSQPSALAPEDVQRERLNTDFSSDWSTTDQFDLENPIELTVTLQAVTIPEIAGAAQILFTMDIPQRVLDQGDLQQDHVFYATLQSAQEVRRLRLNPHQLGRGQQAILRGWPPSEKNTSISMMLVDEIELLRTGELISLHRPHPGMKKKPGNR